jgi:hypothetical protein
MWIMAGKALAVLIGTVKHGVFPGLMTLGTQVASSSDQGDRCFVLFRDGLMAVLTAHPHCGVDKLPLLLLGMAG